MDDYRVALDSYNGPLDLLLFLIRRDEVDVHDIPIARITQQYLEYVEVLRQVDPDAVGEFLVLAATLMEIKSRTLLPRPPVEVSDEPLDDPRMELVRQLLEYRKFKDAARSLEDSAETRAQRHARHPVLPPHDESEVELDNLEIWHVFEAFQRLLEQTGKAGGVHEVSVDDTPLALHADDILDSLQRGGGTLPFDEVFGGRARAEMIGLFLALLELIRQKRIRAVQERPFAPIQVHLLDATPLDGVEDIERAYRPLNPEEAQAASNSELPVAAEFSLAPIEDDATDPDVLDDADDFSGIKTEFVDQPCATTEHSDETQ